MYLLNTALLTAPHLWYFVRIFCKIMICYISMLILKLLGSKVKHFVVYITQHHTLCYFVRVDDLGYKKLFILVKLIEPVDKPSGNENL